LKSQIALNKVFSFQIYFPNHDDCEARCLDKEGATTSTSLSSGALAKVHPSSKATSGQIHAIQVHSQLPIVHSTNAVSTIIGQLLFLVSEAIG